MGRFVVERGMYASIYRKEMIEFLKNILFSLFSYYPPLGGVPRSPKFSAILKELAKYIPKVCPWCGSKFFVEGHHFEEAYQENPSRELDPTNLAWACRVKRCHMAHGHLGDFRSINKNYMRDLLEVLTRPFWNGSTWIHTPLKNIKIQLTPSELEHWNRKFGTSWTLKKPVV